MLLSLNHVLTKKSSAISSRVFEIVDSEKHENDKEYKPKYVQIKKTRLIERGVERIMLQVIDISTSIMYD